MIHFPKTASLVCEWPPEVSVYMRHDLTLLSKFSRDEAMLRRTTPTQGWSLSHEARTQGVEGSGGHGRGKTRQGDPEEPDQWRRRLPAPTHNTIPDKQSWRLTQLKEVSSTKDAWYNILYTYICVCVWYLSRSCCRNASCASSLSSPTLARSAATTAASSSTLSRRPSDSVTQSDDRHTSGMGTKKATRHSRRSTRQAWASQGPLACSPGRCEGCPHT
jgi:hypothetical protein